MQVDDILKQIDKVVYEGQIMSHDWWCNRGDMLIAFTQGVEDAATEAEMAYKKDIVGLLDAGKKVTEARIIAETGDNYRDYRKLTTKKKRVYDHMLMAKIRARAAKEGEKYGG